jgi:hypothetical protein
MKGKVVEELAKKDEVNKSIGKEKSIVFLNLIKYSEYNMVKLLKKDFIQDFLTFAHCKLKIILEKYCRKF